MHVDKKVLLERLQATLGGRVLQLEVIGQPWSASNALLAEGMLFPGNVPVIAKIGVNRNQLYWTQQVTAIKTTLMPTLYASGTWSDLDLNWLVMECVRFDALGHEWQGAEFEMLLDAAVRFQQAARSIAPRHIRTLDLAMLRQWIDAGVAQSPPGPVEQIVARLEDDFAWVSRVCEQEVCHGDVHMCNVVTRTPPPQRGTTLLIDCQPVRQPWAFDAAYPQVLNSIDRTRVGYRDLVTKMAHIRQKYGMSSCHDVERLSRITLAWFAIRMWAYTPERHLIADYAAETERYITECTMRVC